MSTQLSHVSSEGGPVLIGDYEDMHHWNGGEFSLYQEACQVKEFGVKEIAFDGKKSLVWDFGGAGTAYLAKSEPRTTMLVRHWSDGELPDSEIVGLATNPSAQIATATLTVTSGIVLLLWAAEDARQLVPPEAGFGNPKGLAIGDGGCFIALAPGRYEAVSAHYFQNQIEVAALRLTRLDS